MKWNNPNDDLPYATQRVLVAVGIRGHKPEYYAAAYGSYGCFYLRNGSYNDASLYPIGFKGGDGNAIKILAWAEIGEYDGEYDHGTRESSHREEV